MEKKNKNSVRNMYLLFTFKIRFCLKLAPTYYYILFNIIIRKEIILCGNLIMILLLKSYFFLKMSLKLLKVGLACFYGIKNFFTKGTIKNDFRIHFLLLLTNIT